MPASECLSCQVLTGMLIRTLGLMIPTDTDMMIKLEPEQLASLLKKMLRAEQKLTSPANSNSRTHGNSRVGLIPIPHTVS
jgi:hypothetical protein